MATEVNQAKLDKLAKAGKTQAEAASELGVTPGQLGMLKWGQALVRVGKLPKCPKTEASFKKLRAAGTRWEFIAAQTGASVAEVKAAVGDGTYIGRGRKPGAASSGGKTGSAKRSGAKSTPAKRSGAKSSNTKRRSAKRGSAAPTRARTRAQRAARSGNPS